MYTEYTLNMYAKNIKYVLTLNTDRVCIMTMVYDRINITIPKDVRAKLERIAEKERRTVSNMIAYLVEQYKE